MGIEHPDITEIRRWGYPKVYDERLDSLGNTLYKGDIYFEYEGETYAEEMLSSDAIEILELHGAIRRTF